MDLIDDDDDDDAECRCIQQSSSQVNQGPWVNRQSIGIMTLVTRLTHWS